MEDLIQQQAQRFIKKMYKVAEARGIGAKAMIAGCLIILRNIFAVLPDEMRPNYCADLRAFVAELEEQQPTAVIHEKTESLQTL